MGSIPEFLFVHLGVKILIAFALCVPKPVLCQSNIFFLVRNMLYESMCALFILRATTIPLFVTLF